MVKMGRGDEGTNSPKWKEDFSSGPLVKSITPIDVLAVEHSATHAGVVQVGRVVFHIHRPGQGQLCAWIDLSEDDIGNSMTRLVTTVPGLQDAPGLIGPRHGNWCTGLIDD